MVRPTQSKSGTSTQDIAQPPSVTLQPPDTKTLVDAANLFPLLIESDEVAFLFSTLGTAPNSSIAKYVNAKKIPHLFLTTNGDKWGDYETYPWSMAFAPTARTEAKIFATHALTEMPVRRGW